MKEKVNPPIIIILGPTASGKTDFGIKLAKKYNGEIISADSRQIYKLASIGTCQPNGKWDKKKTIYKSSNIRHYLVDCVDPLENFSVEKFQTQANRLINEINSYKKMPIIVGGTGLYLSSLIENYKLPEGQPDYKLRQKLNLLSTEKLNNNLKQLDKITYEKIDHNNRVRLIRALEFVITTGQSFSSNQKKSLRSNTLIIGLKPTKTTLLKNINLRTKKMIKVGLIKETQYLKDNFPESILLKTIGYKETLGYLSKQYTLSELINQINTHTWQYAKRQLTWFKKTPNINWVTKINDAQKLTKNFIKNYN